MTVAGGYRLDVPRGSVDTFCFEDLVEAGRYGEALSLWRGAALFEWAEQPWARGIATRLEEERLAALECRLAQDIDAGLASLVIGEISAVVVEHPLRERLRVLLIRALYARGGRRRQSRRTCRLVGTWSTRWGLEPGAELRAVESAVLARDASLVPRPPRPAAAPPSPVPRWLDASVTLRKCAGRSGRPPRDADRAWWGGQDQARGRARPQRHPHPLTPSGSWSSPLFQRSPMSSPQWLGRSNWPSPRARVRSRLRLSVAATGTARPGHLRARGRGRGGTGHRTSCALPDVRIQTTTREPLRVPGEQIVP